jgi:DNA-3-methyladenine glycosylase
MEAMRRRRPAARRDRDLCSGPAKLCQSFALTGADDGTDLVGGALVVVDDGVVAPRRPLVTTRVGLSAGRGDRHPWRYCVPGDVNISRGPREGRE